MCSAEENTTLSVVGREMEAIETPLHRSIVLALREDASKLCVGVYRRRSTAGVK